MLSQPTRLGAGNQVDLELDVSVPREPGDLDHGPTGHYRHAGGAKEIGVLVVEAVVELLERHRNKDRDAEDAHRLQVQLFEPADQNPEDARHLVWQARTRIEVRGDDAGQDDRLTGRKTRRHRIVVGRIEELDPNFVHNPGHDRALLCG